MMSISVGQDKANAYVTYRRPIGRPIVAGIAAPITHARMAPDPYSLVHAVMSPTPPGIGKLQ